MNFWHFDHFVLNLLFSFSLSALWYFLPTISSINLKHLPDVGLNFSGWERANILSIQKMRLILLITVIFNPFDYLYLRFMADKTSFFPRLQVISKFVSLTVCYLAKWLLHSSDKRQG